MIDGGQTGPLVSPLGFPKVSGRFYVPYGSNVSVNLALGAANRHYAIPFWNSHTATAINLSFNVGTGIVAAWNARCGIYTDLNGVPSTLVAGSDTLIAVAGGSTTGAQTGSINSGTGVQLGGGAWYWLTFVADTSGQSLLSVNWAAAALMTSTLLGGATATQAFAGTGTGGVFAALAFGALPASFGAVTYNNNAACPNIAVGF